MPWDWDFLSTKPSEAVSVKLNVEWGEAESAKGKCTGSSIHMSLRGEISEEQVRDSKSNKWPYGECREQSKGKMFAPYTDACYEASREMSTLRKYQIDAQYEKVSCFFKSIYVFFF